MSLLQKPMSCLKYMSKALSLFRYCSDKARESRSENNKVRRFTQPRQQHKNDIRRFADPPPNQVTYVDLLSNESEEMRNHSNLWKTSTTNTNLFPTIHDLTYEVRNLRVAQTLICTIQIMVS